MALRTMWMIAGVGCACVVGAARAQEADPDALRATVAEMISDAESRSSLLSAGDAGHDTKFFVASDDFRLNITGLSQFRYLMDFRDKNHVGTGDDFTHGFQIARTMVDFVGELDKDWFFRVRAAEYGYRTNGSTTSFGNFNNTTVGFDYANAGYKFQNGWKLTIGQFKVPLIREELVSELYQLGVERSIVNSFFSGTFTQGVQASYEVDKWRLALCVSDGLNTAQNDFTMTEAVSGVAKIKNNAEYALSARGEYLLAGTFKKFEDFTSPKGADFGCMLGGAVHWQQSPDTNNPADVDENTLRYTADASLKGDGWNLYGALCGDHTTARAAGADRPDMDNFGVLVQGGWRLEENTEIYAEWQGIFVDSDAIATVSGTTGSRKKNFHFVTAGITHFFAGHAMQGAIEATYSFQNTANLVALTNLPNTGTGILGESKSGEVSVRLQFQIAF